MRGEKGLTMLETLVGLVLAGILVIVIANVFKLNLDLNRGELQFYEARQQQASLYDEIRDTVRFSQNVNISPDGKSLVTDTKTFELRSDGLYRDGDKVMDATAVGTDIPPFHNMDGLVDINVKLIYGKVTTNLHISTYVRKG